MRLLLGLLLLAGGAVAVCWWAVDRNADGKLYADIASVPSRRVALLLGTSPRLDNGKANLYFTHRIAAAAALYKAGKVSRIIVSGDNNPEEYNEPEEMRLALVSAGVPDSVLYLDDAGFRTLDSVIRAKEIFGQRSLTVVSQKFHNARAVYLAEHHGMEAIGFNAEAVPVYGGMRTMVREALARVRMFWDCRIEPQPRFPGEQIEIK